jgi:hypothetical protein
MAEYNFASPKLTAALKKVGLSSPSPRGTEKDLEISQQVLQETKDNFAKTFGKELTTNSEERSRSKQEELYQRWQNGESGIYTPVNPTSYPGAEYFHLYSMDISPSRLGAAERKWLEDNGWKLTNEKADPVHWQYVGRTGDRTSPPVISSEDRNRAGDQVDSSPISTTVGETINNRQRSNLNRAEQEENNRLREAEGFTPTEANSDDLGTDDPNNPNNYGYDYDGAIQGEGGGNDGPSGPTPNILEKYTNYTYGISLHYMTIEKYNSVMVKKTEYTTNDNTVLIASGGRRNAEFSRNPIFNDDLYFEDFKMNCVIGHNAKSRGSNAIEISFTVVEPLGMSLIDRILKVADAAGIRQWDQMPFVIQIDFFANSPDGSIQSPIPNTTKRICVKIIDMRIKVSTKGSTYNMTAVPQTHVALSHTNSSTPANFEVMAKTVKDFFDSGGNVGEFGSSMTTARDEKNQAGQKKSFKVYSYAAALNSYQKQLKENKHQEQADVYKFEFDSEMADAEIFVPDKTPISRTPTQNNDNKNAKLDREKGLIPINAGTNIKEVINLILRSSKYYRSQILDKDTNNNNEMETQNQSYMSSLSSDQPIKSHKILTTVEYGEWDSVRKQYQKTITYKVQKYMYYNTKYPEAPRGLPKNVDKEYNYMYTGKNQQILDFDIDFNTMFFTTLTVMENRYQRDRVQVTKDENKPSPSPAKTGEGQVHYSRIHPVINQAQDSLQITQQDKRFVEATDLFKSMMSDSRGDMINVKLKIAGDPSLIKQDDTFSNLNNSIPTDKRELYVRLFFRLPTDIDQNTGLYKFENSNIFSGIYRMITVENLFERGQFTQTLDLIRMFDQPDDKRRMSSSGTTRESDTDNNAGTRNSTEAALTAARYGANNALNYENFDSTTGAGEFGEEQNYGSFDPRTGAGEFGEVAPTLASLDLRNLRAQAAVLGDQTDFGT